MLRDTALRFKIYYILRIISYDSRKQTDQVIHEACVEVATNLFHGEDARPVAALQLSAWVSDETLLRRLIRAHL